ncbi:MAG: large conductance mechanosensitive channel protein MscL [Galactobacter sp.]
MLKGFKEFISRGSVIDLAVGVIIGAAFGKIVDALVNSVLMPAIARLFGPANFDDWLAFGDIRIGVLITAVVNFLLVAAAVYFALVMPMNKMARRKAIKAGIDPDAETPDPQIELLTDIRDALRKTEEEDSSGSHRA